MKRVLVPAALFFGVAVVSAADIELSETFQLTESHSLRWLMDGMKIHPEFVAPGWEELQDSNKPAAREPAPRNWVWNISEAQWREAIQKRGEAKLSEVKVDLWVPEGANGVRGIVAISRHGSGLDLFKLDALREMARELRLALFLFDGDPVKRGFWPKAWLYSQLKAFGEKAGHPELEHAPLFLYGHSSAVGFSAPFAAGETDRVWGWVAMRAGFTFQIYQPGAARAPGLVIFGEDDKYFANKHREETLALVPMMRRHHQAVWNVVVEPKGGHGPGQPTWRLVLSFLRHSLEARVPADADPRTGPVQLRTLAVESGYLGRNWDGMQGGYQNLPTAAYADFAGDKTTASWLFNAAYAADWQAFHREGDVAKKE